MQRQYTASVGKVANCQIGVSFLTPLHADRACAGSTCSSTSPESWTSDCARCDRAKIPRDIGFCPKWRIALEMVEHAVKT